MLLPVGAAHAPMSQLCVVSSEGRPILALAADDDGGAPPLAGAALAGVAAAASVSAAGCTAVARHVWLDDGRAVVLRKDGDCIMALAPGAADAWGAWTEGRGQVRGMSVGSPAI